MTLSFVPWVPSFLSAWVCLPNTPSLTCLFPPLREAGATEQLRLHPLTPRLLGVNCLLQLNVLLWIHNFPALGFLLYKNIFKNECIIIIHTGLSWGWSWYTQTSPGVYLCGSFQYIFTVSLDAHPDFSLFHRMCSCLFQRIESPCPVMFSISFYICFIIIYDNLTTVMFNLDSYLW